MNKINENSEIDKLLDEIINERTHWAIEIAHSPTKLQKFISIIFFKQKFKKIIKQ